MKRAPYCGSTCLVLGAIAFALFAFACSTPKRPHPSNLRTTSTRSGGAHSVDELIDVVATSPDRFDFLVDTKMTQFDGAQMAEHLRQRYERAGAPEMKLERWIDKFATHADGDRGMYHVRQADGTHVDLATYLKARIARQ